MYCLGDDYSKIFKICYEGLNENPNNELLKKVAKVLGEYDDKYGIKYSVQSFSLNVKDIIKNDNETEG